MELHGNSGCKLYIIEDAGYKRVKKISASVNYNERLMKQMEKQQQGILSGFKTCEVYKSGYEGDLFYFVMDYLNGDTIANAIADIKLDKLVELTSRISCNIKPFEKNNNEASQFFKDKIESLNLTNEQRDRACIRKALEVLNGFSWEYVIKSHCHGDLTLENIILQGEDLILIDYLDSFYDSWMVDYAKILQDVDIMWSYRNRGVISNNIIIRLTVMRDILLDKIQRMNHGNELMQTIYYILLLNLLRIYPYINDLKTEEFLDCRVEYLLDKIYRKGWRDIR